ncbi:MAG: FAD-dependent oxidoreductase, partial [Spirochaetales bacterium]|nr:FAD-dependent oxidoreductase [Candidatus Physcosoma equi]
YWDHYHIVPSAMALTNRVKAYGCKVFTQLSCGTGRNANELHGKPPYSSSENTWVWDKNVKCHALTKDEIAAIMKQWEHSAKLVRDSGFDGIEIHAHIGYLIDQFLSPLWNHRTDEYGGTPEKNARFAIDIIDAIHRGAGKDFPIIFRLSLDHGIPGGRTLEDSKPLLKVLSEAGVDAFDIDAGCYETIKYVYPPIYMGNAAMEYICESAREATDKPLLNAGSHTPETAVALVESGKADFAILGRQLIADPEVGNKLLEGRPEDVRPCLRCNEECIGRILRFRGKLSCTVNPSTGDENAMKLTKVENPKSVVVIGAGPGGMEAARACAIRGHKVAIYDKDELGGTFRAPASAQFKEQLKKLIDYYKVQLKKLGVEVHEHTALSVDDPVLASCDKIICATGSKSFVPPIKGIDGDNVVGIVEAHLDNSLITGKNLVICGGGMSGSDFALEAMKEMGKKATIIEMRDDVAMDIIMMNKVCLKEELQKAGVTIRCKCTVKEVSKDGVLVINEKGEEELIAGDQVITAFGQKPEGVMAEAVKAKYYKKTIFVGDCVKTGKAGNAIRDGFTAALRIS